VKAEAPACPNVIGFGAKEKLRISVIASRPGSDTFRARRGRYRFTRLRSWGRSPGGLYFVGMGGADDESSRVRVEVIERGWVFWAVAVCCWTGGMVLVLAGHAWWGVPLVLLAGGVLLTYSWLLKRRGGRSRSSDSADGPTVFDLFT
jgi:hypothetical protein